ncbi:MAG: glycosyltransferase family 2 protein [Isosphaeraceae bacterium]
MDESSFLSPADEPAPRSGRETGRESDEMNHAMMLAEAARSDADRAGRELRRAEEEVRALLRENSNLRAENAGLQQLCVEYAAAKEQIARFRSTLEEIFGKRAWSFVKKAETLRTRLNRERTLSGRCWRFGIVLLKRVLRTTRAFVAFGMAVGRSHARRRGVGGVPESRGCRDSADGRSIASRTPMTFHGLPWRWPVESAPARTPRGYYKVLLIAPGGDNAGELADMLRLAEGLSQCVDIDCRILLDGRSDLSDDFARIIPTLELEAMIVQGMSRTQAIGIIADHFHQSTYRRVAVISSDAAGEFFSACSNRQIDVMTWLVESAPRTGSPVAHASWYRCVIAPAAEGYDVEGERRGIDPGRFRCIRPHAGADPDSAWPRFHAAFLRTLEDDYGYHPARDLKVSVIVPNFNHARYLEERLRSIFEQTHPPHEILFLDDASSDESVEVARRLAAESPVPFHLILNPTNSGSTFRQWLKGIDQASGELIWIAESDDTCRPELLERLVPEFFDPDVALAYCQSSMIGPEGQTLADDYVALTNDLSVTHWRYPYSVPALEEIELALSQRNTIPNASAVVFRKGAHLDCRADLEQMRLAGDWLFYATQIRGGRIAFVADALNAHRHHDQTVRHAFERTEALVEEQLHVKARIFESYPLSPNAIARSVGYTVAEYVRRKTIMGLDRPALASQPKLEPSLGRIRSALRARREPARDLRVLIVLSGADQGRGQEAAIRLANDIAAYFHVFVCNARPWIMDLRTAAELEDRITLIEGTLGMTFWVGDRETRADGTLSEAVSRQRSEVIGELIRLYRIDVIHSRGWWADRLVAEVKPDPSIPWFIDLCYSEDYREEAARDPDFPSLARTLPSLIRGVFYAQPDDLGVLPATSKDRLGEVVRIFDGFDPGGMRPAGDRAVRRAIPFDHVAKLTSEAYLAAVEAPGSHDRDGPTILRTA